MGAQPSCLGGCLLRSAPTRETLGTEVDYIKARALQVGFVIPLVAGLSFSSRRNPPSPEAGQGAAPQPVPSGAQSPGRTWVLPSSFHLRPANPLDKSSIGPFSDN